MSATFSSHNNADDDFDDILVDEAASTTDNLKAKPKSVNYKDSIEKYEKVDLFQLSSSDVRSTERVNGSSTKYESKQVISSSSHSVSKSSHKTTTITTEVQSAKSKEKTVNESSKEEIKTLSSCSAHVGSNGDIPLKSYNDDEAAKQGKLTKEYTASASASGDSDPHGGHISSEGHRHGDVQPGEGSHEELLKAEVPRTHQEPIEQYLRAQAEWDAVETITAGVTSTVSPSLAISFNEALAHFQSIDMEPYLKKIRPTITRSGVAALKNLLFGPPKMNKNLHEERNLVFAVAQCQLDDQEPVHNRVLQTIYRQLTGALIDCPRYGSHWEQIGFQGNDPGTDLRGCGFLGLLNLLFLVGDEQNLHLAKDVYKLSLHETQNFPFSVMSINMTRIALQSLREELLSKECNRRHQVFAVVNDFYAGLLLNYYTTWKQQHKTISDSGFVIKDLEAIAKKNPKLIFKHLEDYHASKRTKDERISKPSGKEGAQMDFAGVHELEEEEGAPP